MHAAPLPLWSSASASSLGDKPQNIPTLIDYLLTAEQRNSAKRLILPSSGYCGWA